MRRHPLWTLVAIGIAVRLVLAFAFYGNHDIHTWARVDAQLDHNPLSVYDLNTEIFGVKGWAWPYPPLYLAWIELASGLAGLTGVPFHGTVQLLPILADVGLAVSIYAYLGWRGAGGRSRLAGAALVMLGPCFIAISGYHGQFDQVAILPAVLGLMAWERSPTGSRAIRSGLLIGLGTAMKSVPVLLVLPLLASARSWRARAWLLATAVAVPALVLVPFLVADPTGVLDLRHYQGLPGRGGLSLVTDPGNASAWIRGRPFNDGRGEIGMYVHEHGGALTLLALVALAIFLYRYRPAPVDGAVLLWLTIYAVSPNFFLHYLLWGLPFFIMAGYLREVAILQVALIPATLITYLRPFADPTPAVAIYLPTMICLWAFWVVALVTVARRIVRQRPAHPAGVQPPLATMTLDHARA